MLNAEEWSKLITKDIKGKYVLVYQIHANPAMDKYAEEFARRGFVVLNVDGYGQGMSEQPVSDENGHGAAEFLWYGGGSFGQYDALEFARSKDGRTWFDRLLEKYDGSLLGFTLDTYWLQAAGLDVADFIRTLTGRVPCVHLKDMGVRGNASVMAPVGGGNMDFDKIIAACADAGTEYLLVEQDDCNGEDPFACLEKSYQFLTSRGL